METLTNTQGKSLLEKAVYSINQNFGHKFILTGDRIIKCELCENMLENYPHQNILHFRYKDNHPVHPKSARHVGLDNPVVPKCTKKST